ncbi:hypothetical protein BBN63_18105 [Streptomyces niveus]|uniref:Uncharacterized protein n=1 Tax=Streptomyces niveus TaxID=193462 RepID=A0A1U9QUC6_STRNV|nr:hypothetical protein BBN63_18105 [Streptomyces niveus]
MQLYAIRTKIISTFPSGAQIGLRGLHHIGVNGGRPLDQKPLILVLLGGGQRPAGPRPQGTDLRVDDGGRTDGRTGIRGS